MIAVWAMYILLAVGLGIILAFIFLFSIALRFIMKKRWIVDIIRIIDWEELKPEDKEKIPQYSKVNEHRQISINTFKRNNKYKFIELNKVKGIKEYKSWLHWEFESTKTDFYLRRKKQIKDTWKYEEKELFSVDINPAELYRTSRSKKWFIYYWFSNCRGKFYYIVDSKGETIKFTSPKVSGDIISIARNSTALKEALDSEYQEGKGNAKYILIAMVLILLILIALIVLKQGGITNLITNTTTIKPTPTPIKTPIPKLGG